MNDVAQQVRELYLIGGVTIVVAVVLVLLLVAVIRSRPTIQPSTETSMMSLLEAQQRTIYQISSDHRQERVEERTLRQVEHHGYMSVLEGLKNAFNTQEHSNTQRHNEVMALLNHIKEHLPKGTLYAPPSNPAIARPITDSGHGTGTRPNLIQRAIRGDDASKPAL